MFKSSNFNFIYPSVTYKIPLEKQSLLFSIFLISYFWKKFLIYTFKNILDAKFG